MPTELKHDGRRPDMDVSSQFQDSKLFRQQCYIDGQWVGADGGGTIDVTNPADGSKIGTIPKMGADETRRAIEAAHSAWQAWREKTAQERTGATGHPSAPII